MLDGSERRRYEYRISALFLGRFNKNGEFEGLRYGPYLSEIEAEDQKEAHRYSSAKYKVIEVSMKGIVK